MSIQDPSSPTRQSVRPDMSEKASFESCTPEPDMAAATRMRAVRSRPSQRDEKGISTLGEGPSAPEAVSEVVKCDLAREDEECPVEQTSPGVKGWLCLLGAVMVNTICCKFWIWRPR